MSVARVKLAPAGVAGTSVAHAILVAALVLAAKRVESSPPLVYAVELIAAPMPMDAPRRAPNEAPPAVEDDPAATETPTRQVVPPPPPPPDAPPRTERRLVTSTPVTPLPGETPGTGQDVANVKIAGFESRYQGYVRNIVTQIRNRWQRPLGSAALTTEISFVILKDGSVSDIQIIKRSGNYSFDINARGAIESAGESRAFGPLPTTYDGEALPISFFFTPSGGRP